jgi:tetratricopeptide (TPR) repeat protein
MTGQFRETSVTDTILAVGPEGRLIAHRVDGNRIGVTDTRFQEVVFTLPKMPLTNVFFSVNGEVLFAIGDNMLLAFSMPDGKLLYDLGDIDIAWPTSFSNNSRLAILSLRRPAGFLLVEAKTGRKLAHFPVADDAVPRNLATVFAAGQSRIVSFGRGNEILSWDLKAIKEQLKSFHLDWSSEELALKEVWEVPRSSSIQVDWGGQRRKFLDNLIHGEHALDRTRIELLNRLLEEDAGDVDCLFVRAEAHRQLGHIDLAREDVAKALEISPDDEALKRLQVRLGEVP